MKEFNELSRDERIEIYDKLNNLYKKFKMIILVDEQIKGTHEFVKNIKKPARGIISDNLSEQKYISVRNREYKGQTVNNKEAYFIEGKIVKKIDL